MKFLIWKCIRRQLLFDTLKIDRSFISRISGGHGKAEIVETIIALAHNLGLDVVAEELETRAQLDKFVYLGCEYGQGFLLSEPVTAQDVESFLANWLIKCYLSKNA